MKGESMKVTKIEVTDKEVEEMDDFGHVKPKALQPDWKNAPTVAKLKNDVRECEPSFNSHTADVEKYLALRDGRLKVKIQKGRSKVQPKLIRKQNEWRYASLTEALLASRDMYDVLPSTHADVDSARDNAIVINKQFEVDIDRVEFIDAYVRTAVDEGTVIVRTGWEFEEEVVEIKTPIMEWQLPPEVQQQLQQAMQQVQMGQMDPMQFQQMQQQTQQQMVQVPTGEYEMVEEMRTIYNRPTLEVCDYDKVMIDPTCRGDLTKAGMIAYSFTTSRAELIEDGRYHNIDAIMYGDDDDTFGEAEYEKDAFNWDDKARKKIEAVEYWGDWDIDGNDTLVPIVATYVGSTMVRLDENPFPDGRPPFVKVVYLPKRRDVYGGEPDAVLIEDHQDIIGAVTRGMIDLMGKSANAQQGISANALDPAQQIRFEQGKDYLFNPDIDPTKAFFMSTYPEIPQSAMQMIEFQEHGAEALTSIRAFSANQGGNALGATATAVKTASDATSKREMAILRRLSTGLVDIGKKIISMNAVNLDDEEVIMMTDNEEITISRDALQGKHDLRLSVSTPEVDMEQASDLGFMLQTIGPNMDPGLQAKILGKIARLKKMPDLAKQIEEYKPEPDPSEEKIKELQIALLEAQVQNERAKATENEADTANKYADTELTKAKTQTEQSKTRALDSGSDMQDLEFLQQQSGLNHEQEMDKMDKAYDQELGKKGADSLLSPDTPFKGNNFPPSSGSAIPKFAIGGPDLRGMDSPFENLADSMQP